MSTHHPTSPAGRDISPGDRGIACRRCGCRHHWVVYSRRRVDGSIARRRECRRCGRQFTTRELEIGAPQVERFRDHAADSLDAG
jgi:DNA-directed RNA polymerase subunit RPC12/RpoP